MKINLDTLTDEDLINFVYCELAGKKIQENISDFTDLKKWRKVVNEMDEPVATVYRIGILNLELQNGGLIQYFDNSYGIFAYETLEDFKRIGANYSYKILETCLKYINPKNYSLNRFIELVAEREYYNYDDSFEIKLNELDDEYCDLDEKEDLAKLLVDYVRLQIET
ncbi:hypothetical protein B0A78_00460 [Flavobacterium columnare NBRC 100251 = ATCC 23463]|uniref:DMP19 family protein n=1 Tax=Flavobacterium columnare TaxID=996 RepID=UPI000BEA895C|nr:DUF4375 domain-containing protein [Flavobacterium columnare]MBF6654016.1 DUF4375 domain-containing protein [Flavobacterium columnare]MBF6655794.1 DUF4375 domain-containing protein [Flavobacterium columnare]MBF6658648.1 DUF4375 domain-containing protein [Flavobacterium columnare]PDS27232.1 hypothetical protein B0A78_00460 [Flavobacterium columnare NBRC 100251 = ATCC 23463]GEM59216.1 hypothetical protein FC1_24540 [Flavobacterium columnare NBRC 100251 = ATCC 23463]